RFGDRSIMLIEFGRKEVRPQEAMGTGLPKVLGGVLAVAGAALLVIGVAIASPVVAIVGGAMALLGGAMDHAADSGGYSSGSFEELGDLPAAQEAMSDD